MASSLRTYARPLALLTLLSIFPILSTAQNCNAVNHCATGCCSGAGFCGFGDDFCGEGCQSTCDAKLGCDASNPCKHGKCCSKFGICGLGPDFCSAENCVATCDAKSYCDPGWGPEWSEIGACPLNTCCSKWGFCGVTEEFCGSKKVIRPSCEVTEAPLQRVIGYYEGWAARRHCDKLRPDDIPAGVYTHLNFAYASINPVTFHIAPAAAGDPELYRELTGLKRTDPSLKVFIAIGGRAFNGPGRPTETTFSDIARSHDNQRAFISSLISFMNTYGFDGVDIDWEFPRAEARGGRDEDFVNFPIFLENLKQTLNNNGFRNGLSVMLPASYWYLRHFDIQKMKNSVDWFAFKSYDLHGAWDTPEFRLDNRLNSHTNLTEIAHAMDLLWRNDIPPEKVVMGLAFYSRTFTLSDPKCKEKGCLFDGGGTPDRCSGEVGFMTNSEIASTMVRTSARSTLDADAAVKILVSGMYRDEWITYDDGDTLKLKTDFARSLCLGGVMIWAVSHDTRKGKFSKELQQATKYKSFSIGTTINYGMTLRGDNIPVEQCSWTNCGKSCPYGWTHVRRRDHWSYGTTHMIDESGCKPGQGSRLFCCPPGPEPYCGWYSLNNGRCTGTCPGADGLYEWHKWSEIASSGGGCTNGKSQKACCLRDHPEVRLPIHAMRLWDKCGWAGSEPRCAASTCDGYYPRRNNLIGSTNLGSGATHCYYDSASTVRGDQPYCCSADLDNEKWDNCAFTTSGGPYVGKYYPEGYCNGNCPPGRVKIGLDDSFDPCSGGHRALCCEPVSRPAKSHLGSYDDLLAAFQQWANDPSSWDCGGSTLEGKLDYPGRRRQRRSVGKVLDSAP